MLRTIVLASVASIVVAGAIPAQPAAAPARELDSFTAKAVRDWNVVGLAIAVVKDDSVVLAKGYGLRERAKPAAVDARTLFAIGSTTKAMTAAAIGMLVDDKKVGWDDPVIRHLPTFQLQDPYVTREITVRDLLTHRAGLGNADFLWYAADNSADEILRRSRWIQPAYSLRSSFIYQNVMYAVAGHVVAAASGMPWERFVRTRLMDPLGMRETATTLAETSRRDNVASPHYPTGDSARVIENASVDAVAAAGAVWSSVTDMSKWIRFLLDSGRVDGKRLLSAESYAELFEPQTMVPEDQFYPTARVTRPRWTTYGLGWFQHDYSGREVDFHTGSIDGMVAIVGLIREERLGVVVLANTDHAELRHALMYKAFDLYLGNAPRDWSAELRTLYAGIRARTDSTRAAAQARRTQNTRPSLPMEKYAGVYADSLYGRLTIAYDDNRLRIRASEQSTGSLEHWQYDTFRVRWDDWWRTPSTVTFTIGDGGVPSRLEISGRQLRRAQTAR